MSAAVWGWRGSVSPTLPHSSPLAVPTLLPFPAGHAAAWESTGKPEGCQGGDGGFCISSCPWSKRGIRARLSPVHVRVALLSPAVTSCHWLLLFPQGLEFPASACHRYFQVPPAARLLGTHRGLCRCLTGSRGHGRGPGRDPGGWAEPEGSAGGCGAGKWGCPVGAEGFALLSGGVGGLGFGGEYPSCPRGGGCGSPRGSRSSRSAFPPQGSPPSPTEERWVRWALEVSTVPPLPEAGPAPRPFSHAGRGAGAQGGLTPHPPAGAGCAAGKYCGRKRK